MTTTTYSQHGNDELIAIRQCDDQRGRDAYNSQVETFHDLSKRNRLVFDRAKPVERAEQILTIAVENRIEKKEALRGSSQGEFCERRLRVSDRIIYLG